MPIYTYRCENCGVQFERQQKFTDQPLSWCPECNKSSLRKVYTPVGIVFKGSGFYSTDNRSTSNATNRAGKNDKNDKLENGKSESTEKKNEPTTVKPDKTDKAES
jgi:putative FmdB family regulatory protein